ncbi:MAG: helix-turn-helix domain-containing protein [Nitrospinota bacterium]
MPKNIIGPRVREARRRAKPRVTQADLAARLLTRGINITRVAVSKIENGERHVTDIELLAIAKALAVTPAWLLQENDPSKDGL